MYNLKSDPEYYRVLKVLGKSSQLDTEVICSQYKPDGRLIALKCTEVDSCPTSLLALLQREVRMSRILHHLNIVTYSSAFLHHSKLYVLLPLMEYGSCTDIMLARFKYGLPEQVIAAIIRDILKALTYIHSMHLIHRGVKGSHILLSKSCEVKLSGHRNMIECIRDGVQVKKVHDFPKHDTSLLPWLSPEILQQNMQGYDSKSDIYSLGITACELANGHAPFIDMPSTQMLLEKLNGTIPFLLDESTVSPTLDNPEESNYSVNLNHEVTRLSMIKVACSRKYSPSFHQFVRECLEREPTQRPSAKNLLKHHFFRQIKNRSNSEIFLPIFKELIPIGSDCKEMQEEIKPTSDLMEEMDINDIEWDFT